MDILKQYINYLKVVADKVSQSDFNYTGEFEFDTSSLVVFTDRNSAKNCLIWDAIWKKYSSIDQPVLYWFDFITKQNNREIFNAIATYKMLKQRSVPALKKNFSNWETNTLYVGSCSKIKFRDRIHQHLGYYVEGRTQGLQLCHWAKPLNLKLKLNLINLPYEAVDFTILLENKSASHLKPLIGKHR